MPKRIKILAAFASVALLAAACGSGGGGGGGNPSPTQGNSKATGGQFSIAIGEPHNLFPPGNCYASECTSVINALWAGLVGMKNDKLVYRVAKSITSSDSTHWDIKLNKGYTFHNGDPVTADAFIRAWNHTAYGPNAQSTSGFFTTFKGYSAMQGKHPKAKTLSGLTKVNNDEFKVTLNQPFSQFPYMLLYTPAFAGVTQTCLQSISKCNEKPIGDGPYEMSGSWQHNQQIVVTRDRSYKGPNAGHANQITYKIYTNIATAFRDWQAGNLDIEAPEPSQVPQAKQAAGNQQIEANTSDFTYIGLPGYLGYLKNPKIRHALSLAINRKLLITKLLSGLGTPAQSVVSPIVPGGGGDHCDYCTYNPQRAKKLVKEAGGLPKTITIWVNSGAGNDQWVEAVGNMWKQTFGVNYTIKSLQFPPYLDTLGKHKGTGPYRLGWIMDYPSMVDYLKPIYLTDAPENYAGYSNPSFDALIKKGSSEPSNQAAIKDYTKAENLLLKDMPIIPVYYGKAFYIYSKHVSNVKFDALYRIPVWDVTVNQ
ncbi:MAG: peptide ABC transporter substrate-binding protein [Nocardioidaceae bacterium]